MHKNKLYTILSIFLIVILLGSILPADLLAQEKVGVITGDVVNIRSGPDTSFAKISKAGEGQYVTIINEKNNWFQVKSADNTVGWIASWLVNDEGPVQTGIVTGDEVNIRQGPDTNYSKIGQVKAGDSLPILKNENDWYLIKLPDESQGWIASWLVKVNPKVSLQIGYVNGTVVNVRQNAGITYPLLFQLNKGEQVVIKDKKDDWYLIDSEKGLGWIASWLVNISAGVQASRDATVTSSSWQSTGNLAGKTIVIDPGHGSIQPGGWADPGAIGKVLGVKERDVNLDVALQLQQLLTQQGAKVIMTHATGTTYLSLAGRADIANKRDADIFISIHVNSNTNTTYSGTSVYYYAPTWDINLSSQRWLRQTLASSVQAELVKAGGRKDLGIMEANFAVLRKTTVPSILIETAFVSNQEEERLLNTTAFKTKLAWGIYKGIEKYFNSF